MKTRSKHRSRGAAMVEAAVVMPVLIACWVAGVYAHNACVAKLDTIANARAQAWGYASANCGEAGSPPSPSPAAHVDGKQGKRGFSPKSALQSASGGGGTALNLVLSIASALLPPFPTSNGSDTREAKVMTQGGGTRFHSKQTSKMKVACNEVPAEGTPEGVFTEAFAMMRSLPW